MFLAVRDLRYARGRFLLMGTVVALIAVLTVVLTALTSGLVADGVSGLRAMPATHLAFQSGVDGDLYSQSTVPVSAAAGWAARPGVRHAAAYGSQLTRATDDRTRRPTDMAVFGMEPGSFIAPHAVQGRPLGSAPDGVLVSRKLTDAGIRIGDTLIERGGTRLPVIGTVDDAMFEHVGVVYAPLRTWQRIHYGLPGTPPAQAYEQATAIALDAARTPAGGSGHVLSKSAAYGGSPGFSAETGTMRLIKVFLYVISMFVVGAFFVVWTVQRKAEIAVVRALGGGTGYVLRDALAQVLIVLVTATAAGIGAGLGIARFLISSASSAPIAIEAGPIATAGALLVVLGVLGTLAAVRRVISVDPLLALGGDR